jgi:hypothetical protein
MGYCIRTNGGKRSLTTSFYHTLESILPGGVDQEIQNADVSTLPSNLPSQARLVTLHMRNGADPIKVSSAEGQLLTQGHCTESPRLRQSVQKSPHTGLTSAV